MASETTNRVHWRAVERGGGADILDEHNGYIGNIQWKGNAPLVVRAVNSHDDLLAALEEFDTIYTEWDGNKPFSQADVRRFVGAVMGARAAIRRARGEG